MRRQISDSDIETAIAELFGKDSRWSDGFPCVRDVARRLRTVHGASGTNDRICKALKRARSETASLSSMHDASSCEWRLRALELAEELEAQKAHASKQLNHLEEQLTLALARAELAEQRELAHQDHWADKIAELREQLRQAELKRPRGVDEQKYLDLLRELTASRIELERLKGGTLG